MKRLEYKWIVAIVFVSGLFMDILDTTVVNVALPTLGRQFRATNNTLEWVVTGYLLSLALWIPASGWIGDRFGTKRTFLFALGVFTLGSALCGVAWNIGALIAFRVLQGVGGGMLTPVGTAMLYRAFKPYERAKASAILSAPTMLAPTLGPIVGGLLVDRASWRWIFYINLPLGIAAFTFAFLFLKEERHARPGRFDLPGFVCSGGGLALLLFAFSRTPNAGWTTPYVVACGLGGALLFVALVIIELRVPEPMLDLRLLKDRMFRNANTVMFVSSAGLIGVLFLLPLFLQQLRGLSALQSGLTTAPQALAMIIAAQFTSRLYFRVGPRRMVAFGMAGLALTTACFLRVGLETDLWWIRAIMFGRGAFMSFSMIPLQAATFSRIQQQDTGRAASLFSTDRQVGASVGVAILATVLIERSAAHLGGLAGGSRQAALLGFHDAFFAATALAVVGVFFAFLIHDEDAAPSMRRAAPAPAESQAEAVAV